MKRSLRLLLADKRGSSELIGSVIGLVVLVAALAVCISGIKLVNQYTTLNEFGDQLIQVVSDYGQCGGTAYNETYQKLTETTTLSPQVNFEADYFSAARKTVQYGDPIKITLECDARLGPISIHMTIRKIGRSEQYWK